MVTELLQAFTFDAISLAGEEEFLSIPKRRREGMVEKRFGKQYPSALKDYLVSAKEDALLADIHALTSGLSGKVPLATMHRVKNVGMVQAFLTFLEIDLVHVLDKHLAEGSMLGRKLNRFAGDEGLQKRRRKVLLKEAARAIEVLSGESAPYVQIASELERKELDELRATLQKGGKGLPLIEVNAELIGGARMLSKGKLTDNSWRNVINTLFTSQ
jgi:hypothetical protein